MGRTRCILCLYISTTLLAATFTRATSLIWKRGAQFLISRKVCRGLGGDKIQNMFSSSGLRAQHASKNLCLMHYHSVSSI